MNIAPVLQCPTNGIWDVCVRACVRACVGVQVFDGAYWQRSDEMLAYKFLIQNKYKM